MKRLIVGLSLLLLSGNVRAEDKDNWFQAGKSVDGHYGWNVLGFQADDPRIRGPHAAQPRPTCLIMSYSDAGAMHQPMPPIINIYFDLRTGRLTFEVYPGHTVDWFFLKDKPKRGVAQSSDTALATMALYKNGQLVASQAMTFYVQWAGATSTEEISSDFQKSLFNQADELFLFSTNYPDTSLEIDFQGLRPFLFQSLTDCAKAYQK